jgi:hypothetical protein
VNLESPGAQVNRLEQDVGKFFEQLSPTMAAKNVQRFNAGVDTHVAILLNGNSFDMSAALHEITRADPQWASEFFQLWTRAIAAKSQSRLLERKIDVKHLLAERIRLGKAKIKVNQFRRRII